MRFLKRSIAMLAFVTLCAHASSSNILFSQTSEDENPMPGQTNPSNAMVKSILSGAGLPSDEQEMIQDAKEYLDECLSKEKMPPRKYEALFRSASLPQDEGIDQLFFVRPATEPFCGAFYGAHLFQFWIMTASGKVILHSGADQVTIFKTLHNGKPDLEITNCNVNTCWSSLMIYDGTYYQPKKCGETTLGKNGKERTRRISCAVSQ